MAASYAQISNFSEELGLAKLEKLNTRAEDTRPKRTSKHHLDSFNLSTGAGMTTYFKGSIGAFEEIEQKAKGNFTHL